MVRKQTVSDTVVPLELRHELDRVEILALGHRMDRNYEGVVASEAKARGLGKCELYDLIQSIYRNGVIHEDYFAPKWVREITEVPPSVSVMASLEVKDSSYIREGKLAFLDTLRETYHMEFSGSLQRALLTQFFDEDSSQRT